MIPRRGTAGQAVHSFARSLVRSGLRGLQRSYDWRTQLDASRGAYLDRSVPVTVATVTGNVDFPGIVPMLTGFLTRVGRPDRIVVVDDGNLQPEQHRAILAISPLVEFVTPSIDPSLPAAEELRAYQGRDPMGKKLALLIELTTGGDRPVTYVDTDVWFATCCEPYLDLLRGPVTHPWFMEDTGEMSLDSRVLPEPLPHVNSGFLVLPPSVDWTSALDRSRELIADPEWFTEQTVVHRAMHEHGARTLPSEQFLLSWDDQYAVRDRIHERGVAVRHYVNPVRHKYWVMAHGGYGRSAVAMGRAAWRERRRRLRVPTGDGDATAIGS